MTRLPGWEKWATRPWYVWSVIAVLVAITVIPGETKVPTFVGAGVFLVVLAGAAGWASSVLDMRQFDSKLVRIATDHYPTVNHREVPDTHPMKQGSYYWVWVAECSCNQWTYRGADEMTVRDEARKHELGDYELVKELRHPDPGQPRSWE